jgi:hypothetical protein
MARLIVKLPTPAPYHEPSVETPISDVDSPSVPYLTPQLGTGHPCTRTLSVLYFLIRYLDPKVGNERGLGAKAVISRLTRSKDIIQVIDVAL